MSVNTAHANNGVLIFAGETILLFSDNVTMDFGSNDAPIFKGSKQGRIYLTTHRTIYNSKNMAKDEMKSFSAPFVSLNDVKLEQPTFGANYIKGRIAAQENGGFVGEVSFKLLFKSGGAIDFGQALLRAAQMARNNATGYAPPPYENPSGNWYQAPPPAYTPSAGSYGWLPQNPAFSSGPDPNSVYMTDNPPPYPGINSTGPQGYPQGNGYPPQQQPQQQPGYPPMQQGYQPPGYPGVVQQPGTTGIYPNVYPQNPYPPQNPYDPYANAYHYPAAPGYPPAPYPNGNYQQPGGMGFNPPPYTPMSDQKRPPQ